ncbi:S8 family serine peptidase [Streptomyces corynorhini]|nr:S8 family serine peptidase [Streptomyces corynorhini]
MIVLIFCAMVPAVTSAADTAEPVRGEVWREGLESDLRVEGLIVAYRPGTAMATGDVSAASAALPSPGGGVRLSVVEPLPLERMLVGVSPARLSKAELVRVMELIAADEGVRLVEPNLVFPPPGELGSTGTARPAAGARAPQLDDPNDPYYRDQWGIQRVAHTYVPQAWDLGVSGLNQTIAVVDTGYIRHPDIANQLWDRGRNFIRDARSSRVPAGPSDDAEDLGTWADRGYCGVDQYGDPVPSQKVPSSWHGSHVAGIAAAQANNALGIAGIAYRARILPVRVIGACGADGADIENGIVWAAGGPVPGGRVNAHPADVINLSLGGESACSPTMQAALDYAAGQGITVVIAAGNDNADSVDYSPANCAGPKIVVGALRADGTRWVDGLHQGSNWGAQVDVVAPGADIPSTVGLSDVGPLRDPWNFGVRNQTGTSMAAPHVAAVAALVRERYPQSTPLQVKERITVGAEAMQQPGNCWDMGVSICGSGLVRAWNSVQP